MLPFGSITSIIPLFLLAIAYTLFAGATLLNKIKPPQAVEEEKTIVVKSAVPVHSPGTIHLNEIQGVADSGNTGEINIKPGCASASFKDFQPHALFSGYPDHLFSRPPPAFFS